MDIKAVAFDLDGTLYDRYSTLRSIAYLLHRELRDWFPQDLSAKELGRQLVKFDHRYNYFGGWPAMAQRLKDAGVLLPQVENSRMDVEVATRIGRAAVPYPFTLDMLAALRRKGYRLALLTNGNSRLQRGKLRHLGLEDAFDCVLVSGEVGADKPDPKIFQLCAQALGLEPGQMAYVGDNPMADVQGAYNAGCIPIWVRTSVGWGFPEVKRTPYEINDVSELESLLETMTQKENIL